MSLGFDLQGWFCTEGEAPKPALPWGPRSAPTTLSLSAQKYPALPWGPRSAPTTLNVDMEECCCTQRDENKQVVIQRPDMKLQVIHYSHHDLPTDMMMEPPGTTWLHNRKAADNGLHAVPNEGHTAAMPAYPLEARGNAGPQSACSELTRDEGYTASSPSSTPRQDLSEKEKTRVLGVMKAFALKAFKGVDAWRAGLENGEMKPIRYVLSADLDQLLIEAQGEPSLCCTIGECRGFCRGTEALYPSSVVQMFDAQLLKRLVVMQCPLSPVFILERSAEEAQQLLTSLWVLRSYNQQKAKGSVAVTPRTTDETGSSIWRRYHH